jgi:hypothetical protein
MARSQAEQVAGVHVFSPQEGTETIPRSGYFFLSQATAFGGLQLMGADFVSEAEPAAFLLQEKNDAAAVLLELRKR